MLLSLTNAKLIQNLQLLSDYTARVDVGGTNSITIQSLTSEIINANDTLCVLSGVNAGCDIEIEGFNGGVFDLGSNDKVLSKRDVVAILSIPFYGYITQAEKNIENDLRNKGKLLKNFLTVSQIEQVHIYKTLALICGDKRNSGDLSDIYNSNFDRFSSLYTQSLSALLADYDYNLNGSIEKSEELLFKSQTAFVR